MSSSGAKKPVTILIPQYKTADLTRLCLGSIRKYTDMDTARVVVIDSDSKDESLAYLKSLAWITLIERETAAGESPAMAHSRALDLGLSEVDTPYVLSIHTDTIVVQRGWLEFLMTKIEAGDDIAGVGSWKLEQKTPFKLLAKKIERAWQTKVWYPLLRKGEGAIEGLGKNYYYLRSHCALYRTELVRQHTRGFSDGEETAGKVLHNKLVKEGFRMVFIPSEELVPYVRHLNHATMILNPGIAGTKTGSRREHRRILKELESGKSRGLLEHDDLQGGR